MVLYPAASSWCLYSLLPKRHWPHVKGYTFGTRINPAMQLPQGILSRLQTFVTLVNRTFKLPRSLDPQIAPTDEALSLHGGRAVYTTQPPGWLPAPGRGIASRPTRATGAAGLSPRTAALSAAPTHWIPSKGFRSLHSFPPSQAYPGATDFQSRLEIETSD